MNQSTNTTMYNVTGNVTEMTTAVIPSEPAQVMQNLGLTVLFIGLYVIIFVLGLSGNTLVVYVVVRNKTMQTITNIFITNLAVSDILICLLSIPFTPLGYFLNSWMFGEALCHIVPMSQAISVYVSTLTSTAIAVDRYFVIVYPFKPRMKVFVCLIVIVAIWIISISISLPLGIYMQLSREENTGYWRCNENWPREQAGQFFTVTSLVLQYVVPCSIITYCYLKVSLALKKRSRTKIGSGSKCRERDELEIRRKRRTNRMLIAMVTIFVLCWLMLNIVNVTVSYKKNYQYWYYYTLIFFIAHVIAVSSTIYNPFLYAWMNDNFRKEFKQVLPCLFRGDRERYVNGSTTNTQYTNVDNQPSVLINRSPQRESDEMNNMKKPKVYYDTESERVHLNQLNADTTDDSV